ncbi:MAG: 4Fe-4S binding protein, partial [Planctomycetota bacterium]
MSRDVFVIDEARCTGCHACAIACKDRADLPDEVDWLLVREGETGTFPETAISFRIVHCFHCDEPPCVEACPA